MPKKLSGGLKLMKMQPGLDNIYSSYWHPVAYVGGRSRAIKRRMQTQDRSSESA